MYPLRGNQDLAPSLICRFFLYSWLPWVFVATLGLSLVVMLRLSIAVGSLIAEHGL